MLRLVLAVAIVAPAARAAEVGAVPGGIGYRADQTAPWVVLDLVEGEPTGLRLVTTGIEGLEYAAWKDARGERVSLSQDGGRTWSRGLALRRELPLRAGVLRPGVSGPSVPPALASGAASQLRIVQLEIPATQSVRERLVERGAELLRYLPHQSYIVRLSPEAESRLAGESLVRWIGPFHPYYRIERELLEEMASGSAVGTRRYVLMTFTPEAEEKALLADDVRVAGGKVVSSSPRGSLLEAELSVAQATAVARSEHLLWIERWQAPEPDLDLAREASGANAVELVAGYDGSGVVGEVMDGGVQLTHIDFDGILPHGGSPSLDNHGTCTYGIVFGNGDRDGDGEARGTGMLPAAQGYFADYSNVSSAERHQHTWELAQAPIFASFQSNSWGSGRTLFYTALSADMDDIVWDVDLAIFQSQSNSGDQYSRPQAWAKNVISIGGVNHLDNLSPADDCWCDNASIGPAEDGRIKPELAHWYDAIYSPDREPNGYTGGSYYTSGFGGTSAATPIVAGLGGLFLEMWADNRYGNNPPGTTVFERKPRAATLKALMVNTAEQYPFSGTDTDMARVRQGWGVPGIRRAYDRAPLTRVVDESSPLTVFSHDAWIAAVPPGQPELKVTLSFTDRAGTPASTLSPVNDLTLKVVAPDGTVYWGNNGLTAGPWSVAGGGRDTLNNTENVFLQDPAAGDWRIEVHADAVNQDQHVETPAVDDQDYALVVYGVSSLGDCSTVLAAPTGVTAAPAGLERITVSWNAVAGAGSYEVWRAEGGCTRPRVLAGTVSAPTTTFTDAVAGGVAFGYVVRTLGGCASQWSACQQATTTGACSLAPRFDGLASVSGDSGATCGVNLSWAPATGRCSNALRYNVYRSTDPLFTPSAASLIASCLTTTSHADRSSLAAGRSYTYVVRAEDLGGSGSGRCSGLEEANLVRRSLTPVTIYATDFERGMEGWTASLGTPAADTGDWCVDDPLGTTVGGNPSQPEDDHTAGAGVNCLFTARNPNRSAGQADIDFGEVVAVSPAFDASRFTAAQLRLWRWLFINAPSDDYLTLEVSNDDGQSWTELERLTGRANSWTQVSFDLESFLPLSATMRLRVRAADGDTVSTTVEAAIDDVEVVGSGCAGGGGTGPGVIVGNPGPLLAVKAPGGVARLSWGPDCAGAPSYGVYEGDLAGDLDQFAPVAGMCGLAVRTADVPLAGPSRFFLVAPNDGSVEGSLGLSAPGVRRPPSATPCLPQSVDACAP